MVVGPKELETLTEEDEERTELLENKIDVGLRNQEFRGYSLSVRIERTGINLKIEAKIKKMYIEAGWKDVIFHSEQMEGDWIEFIK